MQMPAPTDLQVVDKDEPEVADDSEQTVDDSNFINPWLVKGRGFNESKAMHFSRQYLKGIQGARARMYSGTNRLP